MRYFLIQLIGYGIALSLALFLVGSPANAQSRVSEETYSFRLSQEVIVPTAQGEKKVYVPDFGALSLNKFPAIRADQTLIDQLQKSSPQTDLRHLQLGSEVDPTQYLLLGGLISSDAFGVGKLNLKQIARLSGANLRSANLSDFGDFVGLQTPKALTQAVPGFGERPLSQVQPIRDLVSGNSSSISETATVQQALNQFPELADAPLKKLGLDKLSGYKLGDLPGFASTPLDNLPLSEGVLVKDLKAARLGSIPLSKLPIAPKLANGVRFAEVDVILGVREQSRLRSISGTVPKNDEFQGVSCPGQSCPHIEIHDVLGTQYSGYAWMDGRQKAKDGYGPLCLPFGCKGPVGNHPFGKAFRVIVTKPEEASGTIGVGLKFRACKRIAFIGKTCTPYFFPPLEGGLPLGRWKEKQIVPFVAPGTTIAGDDFTPPEIASIGTPEIPQGTGKPYIGRPIDGWCDPLPGGIQTHPFGEYPHGSPPHVHQGIDDADPDGSTVYAARDGVVIDTETRASYETCSGDPGGGYGNLVELQHDNGFITFYGHNHHPLVQIGTHVKCGQPIARQGSTGCSFGDHSHFEVRTSSGKVSPRSVGVPNMQS